MMSSTSISGGAFAPMFATSPVYPGLAPAAFELPPLYQASKYCGGPCLNQVVSSFYAPCDARVDKTPVTSQYAATLPGCAGMHAGLQNSSWTMWSSNDLDNPVFNFPESIL